MEVKTKVIPDTLARLETARKDTLAQLETAREKLGIMEKKFSTAISELEQAVEKWK